MSEHATTRIEVRTFAQSDRDELLALFPLVGEGAPSASLWGHEESEAAIYLTPYMDLMPSSLFVVAADGALAGYLTGCLDGSLIPSEDERIKHAIKRYRLMLRPGPARFFARSAWDVARSAVRRRPTAGELDDARWPAHLHINVLPAVRGTGAAAALMTRWFEQLRETGSPGCYLQTLVENERAVRFFERTGFERYGPTPLVPGLRDRGRRVHQQTMVWSP